MNWSTVLQTVVVPLAVGIMLFRRTMKNGDQLVTKPQLRPDLTQPWE